MEFGTLICWRRSRSDVRRNVVAYYVNVILDDSARNTEYINDKQKFGLLSKQPAIFELVSVCANWPSKH